MATATTPRTTTTLPSEVPLADLPGSGEAGASGAEGVAAGTPMESDFSRSSEYDDYFSPGCHEVLAVIGKKSNIHPIGCAPQRMSPASASIFSTRCPAGGQLSASAEVSHAASAISRDGVGSPSWSAV